MFRDKKSLLVPENPPKLNANTNLTMEMMNQMLQWIPRMKKTQKKHKMVLANCFIIRNYIVIIVKGIPEFWLTVLQNTEPLANNIFECDLPILKHLVDIKSVLTLGEEHVIYKNS